GRLALHALRPALRRRLALHEFPPWQTGYRSFRLWRDDGTWERMNAALRERVRVRAGRNAKPSAGILDSQSVKTTGKGAPEAMTVARR
ncbi:MAG: IS5 family transposase, partial [Chloroflexota bacterium]|nr:IS5 family transposase [Chloroflexota bacterium]